LKLVLFCLALGVLPALGETRAAPPVPITLYTQFQQQPPPAVLEALQAELESIMAPIGLRFEWRNLNGSHSEEPSVELAVVTVKGRCDTAGLVPKSKAEGALGITHMSDGQILPFTEISCDKVRNFVQVELLQMTGADREPAFGRALGRVLAHELYHIFANTVHHGSGVAKEAYTTFDLTCDDFQFPHKESEMLRAGRVHATVETAAPPGSM